MDGLDYIISENLGQVLKKMEMKTRQCNSFHSFIITYLLVAFMVRCIIQIQKSVFFPPVSKILLCYIDFYLILRLVSKYYQLLLYDVKETYRKNSVIHQS